MKKNPFVLFLVFISPLCIGMWITGSWLGGFIIWLICLAIAIWVMFFSPMAKKKSAEFAAERAEIEAAVRDFDKETGVLTIRKRSPILAKAIKIEESQDITVAYEPLTLHVGAATVGGVTTGGAYTTGGYNYISSSKKNGRCYLVYGSSGEWIKQIRFPKELNQEAKESIIGDYLDEKKPLINVMEEVELDYLDRQMALQNYKNTGYVGNKAANAGCPTLEKALKIMDWLTTEE